MAAELHTLSFFCVLLLVMFILVRRIRMSVPHLAIILWLAVVNMIRGINALVWDGNVDIRSSVWCDIATKFMLGSYVALPAAFLCISRKLELLGSSRTFPTDSKTVRNRRLLELFLCHVVPVIYVGLHPVSQDHRFDLAKDYGCSPSIHNSAFARAFIWTPPLILCCITLVFCCFAMHYTSRVSYQQIVVHIESRANIASSIFFRQLAISFVLTSALIIMIAFSVFSAPALVPWSSWDAVHSQLWKVSVVTNAQRLHTKALEWWLFFAFSFLYIFISFIIGEEARDGFRWVVLQLERKRPLPKLRNFHLPLFHPGSQKEAAGGSTSHLVAKSPTPTPQLELKSGWDDMLDTRTARWKFLSRKGTPSSPPQSRTPSRLSLNTDEAFMASTLSYLGSPTAKSLGISSPPHVRRVLSSPSPPPQSAIPEPPQLVFEAPLKTKPVRTVVPSEDVETSPTSTSPLMTKPARPDISLENIVRSKSTSPLPRGPTLAGAPAVSSVRMKPVRTDVPPENVSSVSSVLSTPWPVPPTLSNPVSPGTSPLTLTPITLARSPSPYSPTSPEGATMPGYPALNPSKRHLLPIKTVTVPTAFDASVTSPMVKKPLKSALKHPNRREQAGFQGEQLQVVQETA